MGVMKAVGEAVAEGQTYNWDKHGMTHSLRCIGIAPWGYVERTEAFISGDNHVCITALATCSGYLATYLSVYI